MSRFDADYHHVIKREYTAAVLEWAAEQLGASLADEALDELAAKVRAGHVAPPERACSREEAQHALWDNFSARRKMPSSDDGC
jgi:hypothetical protein